MTRGWQWGLLAGLAVGATPAYVVAQQTGAITGRITDRASGQPIAAAQVQVVGTTRGASTGEDGRFRIAGVPDGTYQLRVLRIGYQAATRPVTIAGGQSVTVDVVLATSVVSLDQVVVTATGASERKRENGNDVGIIKPGEQVSIAATPTLTSVLAGKTPGLTVTQNMGTPGTGARIRIRGSNSVSLSNEPLLIVDGVRVNNDVAASSLGVGGATTSRFDDINPEDIESIEVLKGPAASALYGTAASNGVIQITTKRGRAGKTTWRTYGQYGQITDPTEYPDNYYSIGTAGTTGSTLYGATCTLDRATRGLCTRGTVATFNPNKFYSPAGTGHVQNAGLSAAGGGEASQYFISADGSGTQGILDPSKVGLVSGRANINAKLRPNLTTQVTTNYIDRKTRLPYNDNNIFGYVPGAVLGRAFNCAPGVTLAAQCGGDTLSRGYYSRPPATFYYITNQQLTRRFVGGNNTTWQALPWLTAVGQLGLDNDNTMDEVLTPANIVTDINQGLLEGSRRRRAYTNLNYSANGSLTANRPLFGDLTSQTSIGTAYLNEQRRWTEGSGRALVPGTGSLATVGAGKDIGESNQTIITVGGYAREQLAWRDRLFVTGSIRGDENSAFGKDFKLAYYPSVSASWVLSEESFVRDLPGFSSGKIDQFRLRGSYGQAGQRPGFRQADTYLSGVSVANTGGAELTGVVIGGAGNPSLKPEISSEYEVGFDASFFNNRVGLTYTYFNKTTRDALIAQTQAPSLGAAPSGIFFGTPTRYVNLGKVFNAGNELSLNLTALDVSNAKLELNTAFSTLKNELKELGGVPPIFFNASRQRHQEGYPLGAFFQRKYTYSDANNDGIISRVGCSPNIGGTNTSTCELILGDTATAAEYIGGVLPTRELSVTPTLTLFKNLRLSALIQHRGGNYVYNNTEEFRCTASSFSNCRAVNDPSAPLDQQAAAIAYFLSATGPQGATSAGYIEKGDFTKLREASVSLTLPKGWASRARVENLGFTVAGRNLKTWTNYRGFDPEINASTGNFTQFDFLSQGALRMWTARLDVTF